MSVYQEEMGWTPSFIKTRTKLGRAAGRLSHAERQLSAPSLSRGCGKPGSFNFWAQN